MSLARKIRTTLVSGLLVGYIGLTIPMIYEIKRYSEGYYDNWPERIGKTSKEVFLGNIWARSPYFGVISTILGSLGGLALAQGPERNRRREES